MPKAEREVSKFERAIDIGKTRVQGWKKAQHHRAQAIHKDPPGPVPSPGTMLRRFHPADGGPLGKKPPAFKVIFLSLEEVMPMETESMRIAR